MNEKCNTIRDLIPLYKDGACSDESKHLVEEHIRQCDNCSKLLSQVREDIKPANIDYDGQEKEKTSFHYFGIIALIALNLLLACINLFMPFVWLNAYDVFSDILGITSTILLIIIIVLSIKFLYFDFKTKKRKVNLVSLIMTFAVFVNIGLRIIPSQKLRAGIGSQQIVEKSINNKDYTITISQDMDNQFNMFIKLKCTKEIYDEIIIAENIIYDMEYRYMIGCDRGVLINLDLDYLEN